MKDAAGVTEDAVLPSLRERLREAAEKVSEDTSLRKVLTGGLSDFAIGSFATALATYALSPISTGAEVVTAAAGGAIAFLANLPPKILSKERMAAVDRAELIVRVSDRL